jgi:hypothetical protein
MSAAEPSCQTDVQAAFMCTQVQGPETCNCFDNSTVDNFANQVKTEVAQAYMSTLSFLSTTDPDWCKVSNQKVCQTAEVKHSCCCQPELQAYRKCLVETILPAEAGVNTACQHSCQGEEDSGGDVGLGVIIGAVVCVLVLLLAGGGFLFWRRRRRAANTVEANRGKGCSESEETKSNSINETKKNFDGDTNGNHDNSNGTPSSTTIKPTGSRPFFSWCFGTSDRTGADGGSKNVVTASSKHEDNDLEAGRDDSSCSSSSFDWSSNMPALSSSKRPDPSSVYQIRIQPSKAAIERLDSSSSSGSYCFSDDDDESGGNGTKMLEMIQRTAAAFTTTTVADENPDNKDPTATHREVIANVAFPSRKSASQREANVPSPPPESRSKVVNGEPPKSKASPPQTAEMTAADRSKNSKPRKQDERSGEDSEGDDETDLQKQRTTSKADELKEKRHAIESWNKDQKMGSTRSLQSYMSIDHEKSTIREDVKPRSSSSRRQNRENEQKSSNREGHSFGSQIPRSDRGTFSKNVPLVGETFLHTTARHTPVVIDDDQYRDDLQTERKATSQRILQLEEKNKILQYDLEKACKEENDARNRREEANRLRDHPTKEAIRKEKEAAALRIAALEEQNRRLQRKLDEKISSRLLLEEGERSERRRLREERKEREERERLLEYYRLTNKKQRRSDGYGGSTTSSCRRSNTNRNSKALDSDDW